MGNFSKEGKRCGSSLCLPGHEVNENWEGVVTLQWVGDTVAMSLWRNCSVSFCSNHREDRGSHSELTSWIQRPKFGQDEEKDPGTAYLIHLPQLPVANTLPDTKNKWSLWNLSQSSIPPVFSPVCAGNVSLHSSLLTAKQNTWKKSSPRADPPERDLSRPKHLYVTHLYSPSVIMPNWKISCTLTSRHYLCQFTLSPCWPWFSSFSKSWL